MNYFKYQVVALCLFLALFVGCNTKKEKSHVPVKPIMEVDFDTSMGKGSGEYTHIADNPIDVERYNTLKALYEKNRLQNVAEGDTYKIPKIIHQIWVGPKAPPPHFVVFKEKWKALHPDWEYHLWTDTELEEMQFELKDLIEESPNYAEKSDIIRSELLDRFGGVYLDVDMDPFMALDELHKKAHFYVGIENPHQIATTNNRIWLGISIIGSSPNHPVIKRWKELIRSRWDEVNRGYSSPIERVINHTYFPFTTAFFEKHQEGDLVNVTLPTTYFYPLSQNHAAKRRSAVRSVREKIYDILEDLNLKRPRSFSRVCPETIAVHYWGNSWIPSQPEQMKDLQHQLDLLRKDCYRLQSRVKQLEGARERLSERTLERPLDRPLQVEIKPELQPEVVLPHAA